MDLERYIECINDAFIQNGYGDLMDKDSAEKFYKLSNLLIQTNKITNLTAITDETEIIYKHFLDSATVCRVIHENAELIDVGCGAGFPSLPIAILRNDVKITSLDSTGKKIDFVNKAASELGLENVRGVCSRAESYVSDHRETFDVCVGRAVSRLNVLSEICIPFVKIGGSFVAMKASKGDEELQEAFNGIKKLGCALSKSFKVEIKTTTDNLERVILCFDKQSKTPSAYPRNYSQITKKPL